MKKAVCAVAAMLLLLFPKPVYASETVNLALSASVDAPCCSPWESPEAVNDAVVPDSSYESARRYGSWGSEASNVETLTLFLDEPVTVDAVGVYFAVDSSREDWLAEGGLCVPASYTVTYRCDGEYVPLPCAVGGGTETDVMNVTVFGRIKTDSIRFVFHKVTDAERDGDVLLSAVRERQKYYDETYPDVSYTATVDDELALRGIGIFEIEVCCRKAPGTYGVGKAAVMLAVSAAEK